MKTHPSRRIVSWFPAFAGCWLAGVLSAMAAPVPGIPAASHVIAISCDALRGDTLAGILNTRPADYPNFIRLRDGAAATFRARTDYGFTETIPNHSSMVTGRPVYEPGTTTQAGIIGHGQVNNAGAGVTGTSSVIHNLGGNGAASTYKSSIFDVVHESGHPTAFFFSKDRLFFLARSYNATYGADTAGQPGVTNGARNKIDRASPATGFPANATAAGAAFVADADANGLASFTFMHFVDCDTSVHATAVTTSTPPAALTSYENAVKGCDNGLGAVFTWLDSHPAESAATVIILTADHGGIGGTATHLDATRVENYTIPFFILGPGFAGGSDLYSYTTNRTDPGTARASDVLATLPNPPLRNGDLANLAAQILGLPPVPGSYFRPILSSPAWPLLETGGGRISWPAEATAFFPEISPSLTAETWAPLTSGVTQEGTNNIYAPAAGGRGFVRLRRK